MTLVYHLQPTTTMTVEQALASVVKEQDQLSDVLIVGYNLEGELYVRSSRLDRAKALWLAKMLEKWCLGEVE